MTKNQMRPFHVIAAPYLELGWHVFPMPFGTGRLFAKDLLPEEQRGGFYWATNNPDRIREFEDRLPGGPYFNIGLRTGRQSGVVAVDIDLDKGPDVWDGIRRLEAEGKVFPPTATERTPSGGLHWLYRHIGPLPCSNGKLSFGVDIKADGGYIQVAPSYREKGAYTWEVEPFGVTLPPFPRWAQEQLQPPPVQRTYRPRTTPSATSIEKVAWRLEALARTPEGQRNDALFRLYVQALDWGHSPAEIGPLFFEAARHAGLDPKEIVRTMRSAEDREREDPRLRRRERR